MDANWQRKSKSHIPRLSTATVCILIFLASDSFGQTESAVDTAPQTALQFRFEMDDKTRVVGTPNIVKFELDLGYDHISVPTKLIRSISVKKQSQTEPQMQYLFELWNRDRFSGKIMHDSLKVRFSAGEIVLPINQIASIKSLSPPDGAAIQENQAGLIFQFDFEGDSKTLVKNTAADKFHCKLGGARIRGDTKLGKVVVFDGSTKMSIEHDQQLCPQKFTLAAWLNPKGDRNQYAFILGKSMGESWDRGYAFVYMNNDPTHIHFYVNGYQKQVVKVVVPSAKWSHLVGTCDGESVVLYLNGKPVARVAYPKGTPVVHSRTALTIGGGPSGYPWTGELDKAALYGRALTPAEVKELYSSKE